VRWSEGPVRWFEGRLRWSGGPAWRILRAFCVLDIARSAIVLGAPRGYPQFQVGSDSCTPHRHGSSSTLRRLRLLEAREGFGRLSGVEFARFLDIARGSLNECRNHIGDVRDRNYIDEVERSALDSLASRAVGAVAGLQRYLRRRKRKRG